MTLRLEALPEPVAQYCPECSPYEHQVVRDLHWVMASPHLLQESAGLPLWGDGDCQQLAAVSLEWLAGLDAEPLPLHNFLLSSPQNHRLGHYFAALVEFWLRYCPALGAEQVLARQEVAAGQEAPPTQSTSGQELGQQAAGADRVGKLKFLARTSALGALHLEAAIHWSLARGREELDIVAARFAGAFLHESLCWRVLEARNRIRLAAEPAVVTNLCEALGAEPRSRVLFRGYVFYALGWLRNLRLAPAVAHEQLGTGLTDTWSFLSRNHGVGWWAHDVEELLQGSHSESRWVLLNHKRYWLSPVVAVEDANSTVRLLGDAVVHLRPLEAVSADELRPRVRSCRHLKAGHPVMTAELRRSEVRPGKWFEVSRGFLLPSGLAMEAPTRGEVCETAGRVQPGVEEMENSQSITQLQLALERLLYAGSGLEAWWREADKLADIAERTERRSVAAQEARLVELWRPAAAAQALELDNDGGLAAALEERWVQAQGDEVRLADMRCAVVGYLANLTCPAQAVVLGLAGLRHSQQQRVLGHLLVDAFLRLSQKRGSALQDRPLHEQVQAAWDELVHSALAPPGLVCRKLLAKATRAVGLTLPCASRDEVLGDLAMHLEAYGYPGEASQDTQREAQLLGAAQLCGLRLRAARHPPLAREEVSDLLAWLVAAGEQTAALALAEKDVCRWSGARAQVESLSRAHGVPGTRERAGRGSGPGPPGAAAELPRLRLQDSVSVSWVQDGLSQVVAELFSAAAAQGGAVALDAEWRPYTRGQAPTPVELLQLAVPSHCWLLDLPRLVHAEGEVVAALLQRLGGGEYVLVGYGLDGDLQRIFDSYQSLPKVSIARAVDLRRTNSSLRDMVRATLRRELDKTQQCSDWSLRPLSPEQQSYAALDAHVLLSLVASCGEDASPSDLAAALGSHTWAEVRPVLLALGPGDVDKAIVQLGVPSSFVDDPEDYKDERVANCKTLGLTWAGGSSPESCRALAVLPMAAQLALPLAAKALNVPSSRIRMAKRGELVELFGFEAGSLGPFGIRGQGCPVLADASLEGFEQLLVGAGGVSRGVRVQRVAMYAALQAVSTPLQKV